MELHGLILVCQDAACGARMLMRYPACKRSAVSPQTVDAFRGANVQQHGGRSPSAGLCDSAVWQHSAAEPAAATAAAPAPSKSAAREKPLRRRLELEAEQERPSAYSISSVVLAPAFVRSGTMDRPLALSIDDGLFVGWPTPLPPPPPPHPRRRFASPETASSGSSSASASATAAGTTTSAASPSGSSSSASESSGAAGGRTESKGTRSRRGAARDPRSARSAFQALLAGKTLQDATTGGGATGGGEQGRPQETLAITVAFALSLGEDRLFGARHGAVAALQRLSRALGAALQHEERRTGWVSREVRGICRVRDAFLAAQEGAARPTILDLAEVLLEASALCAQLADVYRRVRLCGAAQVLLNGWTALSLSLWAPDVPPHPALRPYMGLMLTDHDLADVAPRGSPALNTLLRACHPTKSFLDLVHETGLPLAHVYRLASHLAYWRAALIILPIRRDSVYTVAPRPRVPVFTLEDTLALKYRTDCPISPPLIEMLRCFTPTVNKGLFLGSVPFLAPSSPSHLLLPFAGYLTFGEYLSQVVKNDIICTDTAPQPPPKTPTQPPFISTRVTRIDEFAQAVWWMLAHGLLVQLQHHVYVSLDNRKSAVAKYLAENQLTDSIGYFEQFVVLRASFFLDLYPSCAFVSSTQMLANPPKRTHL